MGSPHKVKEGFTIPLIGFLRNLKEVHHIIDITLFPFVLRSNEKSY